MTPVPTATVGEGAPDTTTRLAGQCRRLVRAVWLQHSGAFFGMLGLYIACALTIVVGAQPARSMFETYVADHCLGDPVHAACRSTSRIRAARRSWSWTRARSPSMRFVISAPWRMSSQAELRRRTLRASGDLR